jgi:hypothetical protein
VEKCKFNEADFCIGIDGKYIERDAPRGFLGEFCDVKGALDPRGSLIERKRSVTLAQAYRGSAMRKEVRIPSSRNFERGYFKLKVGEGIGDGCYG